MILEVQLTKYELRPDSYRETNFESEIWNFESGIESILE
jgi:hypothetical protein